MNFFTHTLLPIALFLSCACIARAEAVLGIDGEESTSVGIYIKDIRKTTPEHERILMDHNSQMALTPASVMKALTTATALDVLGDDFRFSTSVELQGTRAGATWQGNLVVISSGDPTLESENFKSNNGFCREILDGLKKAGISRITGRIIVRQSLSDQGPILQWECEDIAWPYGAGLFGLNWRDNTFTLSPATGKTTPYVPDLKIDIRKSSSGNDLVRGVESNRLVIYATNPQNRKWVTRSTMPDPAAVFEAELSGVLRNGGITLGDKEIKSPGAETLAVCTHRSPRSAEIFRSLMVRSDNLFAEGMLRASSPGTSRKKAIEAEKALWSNRGINAKYTIINDGSGLTRANRLSPRFLGNVLEWMASSPHSALYASFFPRAGLDGTMKGFLAKSELEGRLALKTGSVSSVQCYAGYLLDPETSEPTHVVVVMINGFFCPRAQVRKAVENLLLEKFTDSTQNKD
ncbi:MAG: D-alanyl-D-alanine carboxypeptidase/D-alanyl-D-alanine-endopeptidase [Muribaculaceae bacterium]|nr:D-alanyl-D-alanine carboxypeptidase/D-alanyl-D-alanine-endopeptidase [Muribaculaceae bacterium]